MSHNPFDDRNEIKVHHVWDYLLHEYVEDVLIFSSKKKKKKTIILVEKSN